MYPDVRPLDKQEVNITIGSFRDHLSEGICINNRLLLDGMGSRSVRGFWEPPRTLAHINVQELGAVYLSLRIFLPLLQNKHVLIKTDNMSAVYHINPPGWNHISIMSPGDKQTTFLIISETIVSQSSVHTESSKQSSRPAVSNWTSSGRVASPSQSGKTYMGTVWYGKDRFVSNGRDNTLRSMLFPEQPGRYPTDRYTISRMTRRVVECFSSFTLDSLGAQEGSTGPSQSFASGPKMAKETLDFGSRSSLAATKENRSPVSSGGNIWRLYNFGYGLCSVPP